MQNKITYLTEEGLQKIREELANLQNVERPKVSKQIAEARDKGDLSENAEYDAAKEAQVLMEMKIAQLQEIVINTRLIDNSNMDISKVQLLSKVTIQNVKTGAKMTYTIVGENEADLKAGKLSMASPIAQGLMGKKVNQSVIIDVPNGKIEFKLLDISK
jgi:transcription elongation factor GreA